MPSLQSTLLNTLFKLLYSNKKNTEEIDLDKARAMNVVHTPKKVVKTCKIEKTETHNRAVYTVNHPNAESSQKTILYLHGGAYISGIIKFHWLFAQTLSKNIGCRVVMPDYPIAPEQNYRDCISFSIDVYKELIEKYDSSRIYVIGDSSGGGLALALTQKLFAERLVLPQKLILLSPWLDVSMSNPEIVPLHKKELMLYPKKLKKAGEYYADGTDVKNPLVSPINSDVRMYPEQHLFIGTHDILLADSRKYVDKAKESGINISLYEYEKMMHCWMFFPIPEAKQVVQLIQKIIG